MATVFKMKSILHKLYKHINIFMIMHFGKSKLDIKRGKFLDTSYKVITPYVCTGSLHWRKIFSSKVLPWMDSSGTALGTNR